MGEAITNLISEVQQQEAELLFNSFTSDDAMEIGTRLYQKAKLDNLKIAISISVNRRQLFHCSLAGATPDNDNWLRKKENVVYHFFKSSYQMALLMEVREQDLCQRFGLSSHDYVASGGSFPITLKSTGVIGAISVSGLPHEEDHAMVVNVIQEYLQK
ncbi:heme-degrading domain-containing protein [Bacillus sp. JJ1566]|uniref:heme-degrading domain-containing protein n=1 Tax=Bacillus sp. JJ1566 TaxID=3122961 RepID=UPI002FFFC627